MAASGTGPARPAARAPAGAPARWTRRALAWAAALLGVATVLSSLAGPAAAADGARELPCLMCHKYRGLSRIDEQGNFRLFYINADLFAESPHSRNACQDCHTDIDRIPHRPAKKVDCTQECHLIEPSGRRRFSHKPIREVLARSVHSRTDWDGTRKHLAEDYPDCKDCHDMPLFRPLSFYKGLEPGVSERGLTRCKSCHTSGDFAESFYKHVTSRLHKTRAPKELVQVCAKCHGDKKFLKRHLLDDVVTSYKQTFHYKKLALGSEETPDCVDCHVVKGENVHLIEAQDSPTSSIYPANVPRTCRSSECHSRAGPMLAGFQTHVSYSRHEYPLQFYMLLFFKGLLAAVMYFFLTFIFLELLRRLFPDFSFNRAERERAREARRAGRGAH